MMKKFIFILWIGMGMSAFCSDSERDCARAVSVLEENDIIPAVYDDELQFAVRHNSSEMLELLISAGAAVKGSDGAPLLSIAAARGYTEIVATLIEAGADVNAEGYMPLSRAAANAEWTVVRMLLDAGACDASERYHHSALYYAAQHGNAEIVRLLLAANESPDCGTANEVTPLMAAARLGHAEVVRLLLAAGANVNARSIIASDDVLHNALCSDNPEVIRMILAAPGLNTNGRNPMELGIARGDAAAVQACIDSGADVNSPLENGYSPLAMAARLGHAEIVQLLLRVPGIELDKSASCSLSPLECALFSSRAEVVLQLLAAGADVSAQQVNPVDVLRFAETCPVFERCLLATVQLNKPESNGRTPLMQAARNGCAEDISILLKFGADARMADADGVTALHLAASAGNVECMSLLLQAGADVNAADNMGQTVLHAAVAHADFSAVEFLLSKVEDANKANAAGETPLHLAALNGDSWLIELLLSSSGAEVNAADASGKTALMCAIENENVAAVNRLLSLGADANLTDSTGRTALFYLLKNIGGRTYDMASILLEYGADVNVCDNSGVQFLPYAEENGWDELQQLFLEYAQNEDSE